MPNPYRGDVSIQINDTTHVMRLHLGALLALENALESPDLVSLVSRFEEGKFNANDVIAVLLAGLQGGGWTGNRDDLLTARIDGGLISAARAAGQLLTLSFQLPDETP